MRVGVVGIGAMGKHHVRVYRELGYELSGIADINPQAEEVALKYNTKYYFNYKELLDKVDAVSIAVPTSLHKKVALDFIKNGIHCLIEKPIASNIKDAEEIAEQAEKYNVKVLIGQIERFNPVVQKLKEIVDEKILGELIIINTRRVGPYVTRVSDVGIVIDLATHDIDIVRYITKEEAKIKYSKVNSFHNKMGDSALIVLELANTLASIEVNWYTPHVVRTLVATGSKGVAYLDYHKQDIKIYNSEAQLKTKINKQEPLKVEIMHFIDCIRNKKKLLINPRDAIKTLSIALKVQDSIK